MDTLNLTMEEGWLGMFTRRQARGMYPAGTRIVKSTVEKNDVYPLGARATVLGSVSAVELGSGYFVEWDGHPRHAFFVMAHKVRRMTAP